VFQFGSFTASLYPKGGKTSSETWRTKRGAPRLSLPPGLVAVPNKRKRGKKKNFAGERKGPCGRTGGGKISVRWRGNPLPKERRDHFKIEGQAVYKGDAAHPLPVTVFTTPIIGLFVPQKGTASLVHQKKGKKREGRKRTTCACMNPLFAPNKGKRWVEQTTAHEIIHGRPLPMRQWGKVVLPLKESEKLETNRAPCECVWEGGFVELALGRPGPVKGWSTKETTAPDGKAACGGEEDRPNRFCPKTKGGKEEALDVRVRIGARVLRPAAGAGPSHSSEPERHLGARIACLKRPTRRSKKKKGTVGVVAGPVSPRLWKGKKKTQARQV